jgi:hypothetical protein
MNQARRAKACLFEKAPGAAPGPAKGPPSAAGGRAQGKAETAPLRLTLTGPTGEIVYHYMINNFHIMVIYC